uniref:Exonuclease 3'-5' domain-containing protein 1 n=1 Tax=Cacopsylla melanoneura TaxID=428564 RepID=A0A8D8ZLK3_9HEMI
MDSSEYEKVRNLTLLFFYERLLDKGGPRTLHDLSCQFGAKGFTKEMRQIAGGSQSGLKKFLAQYPSLFMVDGDHVYDAYEMGSHSNDSNSSNSLKQTGGKRDYAKEAVEYFTSKLLQYGADIEVPIKSLLGHRSQASPEVRHISGQHIREFKEFLMRFPENFHITDDNIILTAYAGKERKPFHEIQEKSIDFESKDKLIDYFQQAILSKGLVLVEQLFHSVTSNYPESVWSPFFKNSQDLLTFLKMHSNVFNVQSNTVKLAEHINHNTGDAKTNIRVLKNNAINLTQTQIPLSPPETKPDLNHSSPPQSLAQNQTFKQRFNSLILKTIAQNTEKDQRHPSSNGGFVTNNNDNFKTKVLQNSKVITNIKESSAVIDELMKSDLVTFDCEGINPGIKGQITLFSIGQLSGQVYLFDLVTCPDIVSSGGLSKLLESENVVKVIHDCRNDSILLFEQFGITLRNVFDTQAAHAVLQFQETGKPVYKVRHVSLKTLAELVDSPLGSPLKEELRLVYKKDPRYWARRPLTRDMIVYAASDLACLLPRLYVTLNNQIKPEYGPLLVELSEEQVYMHIKPNEVRQRKKQRKIDNEVTDLKLKLSACTQNGRNIVLSNREIRLLRYLELTDEEKELVKASYKVARKLEKLEGRNREGEEGEMLSLESVMSGRSTPSDSGSCSGDVMSPSEPLSLTDSMLLMDDILSDSRLDQLDRIERIEAILTAATSHVEASANSSPSKRAPMSEAAVQTVSTGDIVITKVYVNEEDQDKEEKVVSPKKYKRWD